MKEDDKKSTDKKDSKDRKEIKNGTSRQVLGSDDEYNHKDCAE